MFDANGKGAMGSVASKLTAPGLKRISSLLMVCPLGISSKATWTYLQTPGRETLGLNLSDLFIRHRQNYDLQDDLMRLQTKFMHEIS